MGCRGPWPEGATQPRGDGPRVPALTSTFSALSGRHRGPRPSRAGATASQDASPVPAERPQSWVSVTMGGRSDSRGWAATKATKATRRGSPGVGGVRPQSGEQPVTRSHLCPDARRGHRSLWAGLRTSDGRPRTADPPRFCRRWWCWGTRPRLPLGLTPPLRGPAPAPGKAQAAPPLSPQCGK